MTADQITNKRLTFRDLLFTPLGCLVQASPVLIFILIGVTWFIGDFIYNNYNVDLFGIGAPDYAAYKIDSSFSKVQDSDNLSWSIAYEKNVDSDFKGLVSDVVPIRMSQFPFLTHDILITTGDYSDPSKVILSLSNHHFMWVSKTKSAPKGTANLLHAVPENEEIYRQLLQVQRGKRVEIKGREILRIDAFDPKGKLLGWWQDSGCNSLVVKSVTIQ
jgi:hypothetical protein